jgi:hypothetical protein
MSEKRRVLVVPHTHWDRAWYWPAARLQVRLIECVSTVLELCRRHPEYRFSCDGQALMVEDYLQARPQDREELARLVREGCVSVGPLYCQPDLYCTGGESLIRNLLIGSAAARALGAAQNALYLPDTFGIIPSLPMIARGFGIRALIFMRGLAGQVPGMTSMSEVEADIPRQVPEGTRMFAWSCPDGSEVRTFLLRDGYANAGGLGRAPDDRGIEPRFVEEHAVKGLLAAAERQAKDQAGPYLLLAGVDHQIPQVGLPAAMRAASGQGRFDFRFAGFDELSAAMAEHDLARWPRYQGEFHGSGAASVLGGTISARIELKQRNAEIERLLLNEVEPAAALARLSGIDDPCADALNVSWRWLLQNHPHDDICGCSVDAVHRDEEFRFHQAEAGGDGLRRRLARRLVERFGGAAPDDERFLFIAFNAQPAAKRTPWRIKLDFEARRSWGDYQLAEHYRVVDEAGRPVPFRELSRGRSVEHPHGTATLELHAELPPASFRRFFIEPLKKAAASKATRRLENRHLRVDVARDGSFTLVDKSTGKRFAGLGLFGEQADIGDEYDFGDIVGERERLHGREPAKVVDAGARDGVQALRIVRTLRMPAEADAKARKRSRKRVALPTTIDLVLGPDAEQLDVLLSFTNTAKDHRLRWCLPLPFAPSQSRAGLKFNEVTRPAGTQPMAKVAPRIHPEHPGDHFVAAAEGDAGLAVFAEFPFNYEIMPGKTHYLAICVLRAVGWLTRVDLATRKGGAGPDTPTPEAQCLGRRYAMRFALRPFAAKESSGLFAEAARWRAHPLAAQMEGTWQRSAPSGFQGPFLSCDRSEIVLTALKPAQAGTGAVARFFNASPAAVSAELRAPEWKELRPLSLAEEPTGDWRCERAGDGRWRIEFPPYSLRTVALG